GCPAAAGQRARRQRLRTGRGRDPAARGGPRHRLVDPDGRSRRRARRAHRDRHDGAPAPGAGAHRTDRAGTDRTAGSAVARTACGRRIGGLRLRGARRPGRRGPGRRGAPGGRADRGAVRGDRHLVTRHARQAHMSGRPAPLPNGFAIRLAPGTRVLAGGEVLIGGSPTRLLRLRPRAAALLAGGRLTVTDPGTAALARRLLDTAVAHPDPAATTAPIPGPGEVTVVIPVLGDQAGIDRLLAALDPQLPVIVVDDGSPVPIRAMRPGTRVLRHESPRGPAAARNTG